MIVYIRKNRYIGIREKYVIEFMLNTLGYFFEWIAPNENTRHNELILEFAPLIGKKYVNGNTLFLPKIADLETLGDMEPLWQEIKVNGASVPLIAVIDNSAKQDKGEIFFDILANVYYHLARIEELSFEHPDQIDDNIKNAVLYRYGRFKIPIVDVILSFFDQILREQMLSASSIFFKKCAYPKGQVFGAALTHDVDIIRAYHPLKKLILSLRYRLKLSKSPSPQAMDKNDEEIWGFNKLLEFYEQNNWKGVFFFIARYREGRHFRYRLNNKKIKAILKRLKGLGHEIAWHPSRYAFERPNRYHKELKRLQKVSNSPIYGMRHHYLRCLYPQIWRQDEAMGLAYDAGLTYRRQSGFRAGTTHPFTTFDHRNNRPLTVVEFPTTFFEASIAEEPESIPQIINTIKSYHGLLTILWHTNNFYDGCKLYDLWLRIITEIKQHNIFIATLKEHLFWRQQRIAVTIAHIKTANNKLTVIFNIPERLDRFSLKLFSADKSVIIETSDNVSLIRNDDILTVNNGNGLKKIELDIYY